MYCSYKQTAVRQVTEFRSAHHRDERNMGAISEMSDMSKPSPFQVVETAAIQLTINQNKAPSTHMFLI